MILSILCLDVIINERKCSMIKGILKSLIGNAGEILDEVITTDEERLDAKRKLKELILNHQAEMERNISDRWKADMNSDSWLSKNVRPMVLIFLLFHLL